MCYILHIQCIHMRVLSKDYEITASLKVLELQIITIHFLNSSKDIFKRSLLWWRVLNCHAGCSTHTHTHTQRNFFIITGSICCSKKQTAFKKVPESTCKEQIVIYSLICNSVISAFCFFNDQAYWNID